MEVKMKGSINGAWFASAFLRPLLWTEIDLEDSDKLLGICLTYVRGAFRSFFKRWLISPLVSQTSRLKQ